MKEEAIENFFKIILTDNITNMMNDLQKLQSVINMHINTLNRYSKATGINMPVDRLSNASNEIRLSNNDLLDVIKEVNK